MNRTPNYSFEKPEGSDLLVPDPFNNNFDKIDTELYNLNEAIISGGGGTDSDPWELLTHGVHEVTNVRSGTYIDLDTGEENSFSSNNHNYVSPLTPIVEDTTKNISDYGLLYLIAKINLSVTNSSSSNEYYFAILPGFANDNSGTIQQGLDTNSAFLYAEPLYANDSRTYDLHIKVPMYSVGYARLEGSSTSSYRGVVNLKSPLADYPSRIFYSFPSGLIPNKASDDNVAGSSGTAAYYNHLVQHMSNIYASTNTTGSQKTRTFGFRLMRGNDTYITFNGSIEYKLYGKHAYAGLSL